MEVKGSVVELLDVMLEEISPQTLTLAKVSATAYQNFFEELI